MSKQTENNFASRAFHKRLALKTTVQFIAVIVLFEVAYILLNLLFLIIMGATSLDQTEAFQAFKPFLIPIMVIVSIAGCGYISYRFMLRPLEHLDEVAEAAQKLAHPTDAPIILSGNLKNIEDDLNRVREQTLQSLKSVQIADQRKDDMLVYLAHDLKTPLTSVLGYLKLIEDEQEIAPELVHKYSGIARTKAQRLEELINEFFEITRFRTHKLSLEPVQTHLSRMLMQITYEFNPILAEKGLEWDLQIAENIEIVCDADKLERAIDKIICNVRGVQEIVRKVLLDDVLLVPRADDKLIEAVGGVQLHNVPQNGHPAQLHHGLGLELGFFRDPGAEATGKNYDFHNVLNSSNVFAFSLIVFVS